MGATDLGHRVAQDQLSWDGDTSFTTIRYAFRIIRPGERAQASRRPARIATGKSWYLL